jgi:hypothetical protein
MNSQSKKGLSVGTIIGSVIGSVVAVSVTGAFVLFRRQRRREEEEDVRSSYMNDTMTDAEVIATPFVPTYHETTQEVGALGGMAREYTQSPRSETPQTVPDGRFLPSPFPQMLSNPMGAASGNVKGSPLRRADTFASEGAHSHAESSEPQRELAATPTVISEPLESVPRVPREAQGLRSVVESLQREMEQLRAERFDAPPSYTTTPHDGV